MIGARQVRTVLRALRRLGPRRARHPVICFGDSMTSGKYPHFLAMRLGVAVSNRGIGGQTSTEIADRVVATPRAELAAATVVLWMGTNDYDSPAVLPNIRRSIAHIGHDRILVLGIVQGDFPGRDYTPIADNNACLAGPHFVDIPALFGGLVAPAHLRVDRIHLNNPGFRLVAGAVAEAIEARGW